MVEFAVLTGFIFIFYAVDLGLIGLDAKLIVARATMTIFYVGTGLICICAIFFIARDDSLEVALQFTAAIIVLSGIADYGIKRLRQGRTALMLNLVFVIVGEAVVTGIVLYPGDREVWMDLRAARLALLGTGTTLIFFGGFVWRRSRVDLAHILIDSSVAFENLLQGTINERAYRNKMIEIREKSVFDRESAEKSVDVIMQGLRKTVFKGGKLGMLPSPETGGTHDILSGGMRSTTNYRNNLIEHFIRRGSDRKSAEQLADRTLAALVLGVDKPRSTV